MQTDLTEKGEFSLANEEGFTQTWDTVGAGEMTSHVRESSTERSDMLQL